VSVNVEKRTEPPGETDHVAEAWELKERIRSEEGVLRQRRGSSSTPTVGPRRTYWSRTTRSSRSPPCAATATSSFWLSTPITGGGHAERLIADVAQEHRSVTCHARTTNTGALGFYEHLGFEVVRRIDDYYEDGGDAYYLKLGGESLRERLSGIVGR